MLKRIKYIEKFRELLLDRGVKHIMIISEGRIGKSTFLRDLESDGVFGAEDEYQYTFLDAGETLESIKIQTHITNLIIDTSEPIEGSTWEAFISKLPGNIRLIATSQENLGLKDMTEFVLPSLAFREYAESQGHPISIKEILDGAIDIGALNVLRDTYIERGAYPLHLTHPDTIVEDFRYKCTFIESELFEKEKGQFLEYTRALAMNVGNLFKADGLAKLLDISRRKVNKYTEILLKHGILKAIGPWAQNTTTETSRHVKLYFSDLSYLKALLGDTHYQGTHKIGALENFVLLELERKLDATHTISYYRKKSGAEITFILEDQSSGKVTPIEVTTRDTDTLSQAFRTFHDDYKDRVERYMLVNGRLGNKKDLDGVAVIIIPHVAI